MPGYKPFVLIIITATLAAMLLSCPEKERESNEKVYLNLTTAVPQRETATAVSHDFAGMCHSGYSNDLTREYAMLDEMGVVWLHRDFSWSTIQPEAKKDADPSDWNWSGFDSYVQRANQEGKKIMGMLLYDVGWVHTKHGNPSGRKIWEDEIPDFCKYAVETVKRYNGENGYGKVDVWLIWNEPDLTPRFWTGTKEEYFALSKATAEAIRNLDEEKGTTTVLLGGVFTPLVSNYWITGLFEHGGMDKIDGIAFHPYGPVPSSVTSVFNSFKQKVAVYGFGDKIWLNEMGYPTYLERGVLPPDRYGTDQYEGDMPETVTKTFALLAAAGARNLTWYHLFDSADRDTNDSEDWFGLVWRKSDSEWIKKGGYWGYALCANNIPGKTYKKLAFSDSVHEDIYNCYFEGNDGKRALIVWNNSPLTVIDVNITLGGSNHKLWNVETGTSENVGKTSVHTLHPINTYQQTLVFLTWDE